MSSSLAYIRALPRSLPRRLWAVAILSLLLPTALAEPGLGWKQIPPPSGRVSAAMAYDSVRGKTVLFGGGSKYADTWEWDGSAWKQIGPAMNVPGPGPVNGPAMAYDSALRSVVLFGGVKAGDVLPFQETWLYGPVTLTIADAVEALRWAAGMVGSPKTMPAAYDVSSDGPSAGRVDLVDALAILRRATGLDA